MTLKEYLNETPRPFYILDASAIAFDPDPKSYNKRFEGFKDRGTLVLTQAILQEIDKLKRRKSETAGKNARIFVWELAQLTKPISTPTAITGSDLWLWFWKDLKGSPLSWLSDTGDREVLAAAITLRDTMREEVAVVSCDGMLKLACLEEGVDYIFMDEQTKLPDPSVTKT